MAAGIAVRPALRAADIGSIGAWTARLTRRTVDVAALAVDAELLLGTAAHPTRVDAARTIETVLVRLAAGITAGLVTALAVHAHRVAGAAGVSAGRGAACAIEADLRLAATLLTTRIWAADVGRLVLCPGQL
jgi:hypothetical protein